MSDTIIGAIIGAAIALAATAITAIFGYCMWARSLKYQILKGEREYFEKKFDRYLDYYSECLKENGISARLGAALMFEFPEAIRNQFGEALKTGVFSSNDPKVKQKAYFQMAFEMSKILAKHNTEISKICEFVDSKKSFEVVKDVIQSGLLKW